MTPKQKKYILWIQPTMIAALTFTVLAVLSSLGLISNSLALDAAVACINWILFFAVGCFQIKRSEKS